MDDLSLVTRYLGEKKEEGGKNLEHMSPYPRVSLTDIEKWFSLVRAVGRLSLVRA